jgi:ABC-type phosphonate transport system ATPase subunit
MVQIITGKKGSGKTKWLIEQVHAAVEQSSGNVVCVEQLRELTTQISSRARLIATDDYAIVGYDALYGFLSGLCAGNYDITDIFVDATLRIGGRDFGALLAFLRKAAKLETKIFLTISADESELPKEVLLYQEPQTPSRASEELMRSVGAT